MKPRYILTTDLHAILSDAIAQARVEKTGPVQRGAIAALEGVIRALELEAGATTTIIRGE